MAVLCLETSGKLLFWWRQPAGQKVSESMGCLWGSSQPFGAGVGSKSIYELK